MQALKILNDIIERNKCSPNIIIGMDELLNLKELLEKECCRIFSTKIKFEKITGLKLLTKECVEIWDNPDRYGKYKKNSEQAYEKFLQYLFVEFPDGKKERLSDIVMKNYGLQNNQK